MAEHVEDGDGDGEAAQAGEPIDAVGFLLNVHKRIPALWASLDKLCAIGRRDLILFRVDDAVAIAPADVGRNSCARGNVAKAEMEIGAAFSAVPVTAVNLLDDPVSVGEMEDDGGTNGGPGGRGEEIRMAIDDPAGGRSAGLQGQEKVKSEEVFGDRTRVVIEVRRAVLVGDGEVEPAIAFDIGHGDSAAEGLLGETDITADVPEMAVAIAGEKGKSGILITQAVARLAAEPDLGIFEQCVVGGGQLVQPGPDRGSAAAEPRALDEFDISVVGEVTEFGVPSPTTARQAQFLAFFVVGGDAPLHLLSSHLLRLAGVNEREMALLKRRIHRRYR